MTQKLFLISALISFGMATFSLGAITSLDVSATPHEKKIANLDPTPTSKSFLELVNRERARSGLGKVYLDGQLNYIATYKACDILNKGYWSHESPDGKTAKDLLDEAGILYQGWGENLARDFSHYGYTFQAWMDSLNHRAIILNPEFKKMGIGVCSDIVVQLFTD